MYLSFESAISSDEVTSCSAVHFYHIELISFSAILLCWKQSTVLQYIQRHRYHVSLTQQAHIHTILRSIKCAKALSVIVFKMNRKAWPIHSNSFGFVNVWKSFLIWFLVLMAMFFKDFFIRPKLIFILSVCERVCVFVWVTLR